MEILTNPLQLEIWHRNYNPDKHHNLQDIPASKAVFGIFAIVKGKPGNCRYIGITENLRAAVQELFEQPKDEGLKKFMQGTWIPMLVYTLMLDAGEAAMNEAALQWTRQYQPAVDAQGEYPGYYSYR